MEDLKEGRLIISLEDFNNIMYMLCETDMTLGEIAKVIGVERHYIINIYLRNNLENLTEGYKFREKVKTKLPWIRENKMEEIKALREKGYNADKIAQELNLPLNAIRTLVKDGTLRHIKARTIYKFDLDGTFEGKYNSLKEAHESTFSSEHPLVDSTGIILCLKGERFQAGHKFWSESPDFTVPLYQKVCLCDYSIGNPVIVYDLDGIPLNGYKSSKEASRKLFNSENFYTKINNVCKNKLESYKGYKFKYAKEVPDEDLLYILKNRENSPQQEG